MLHLWLPEINSKELHFMLQNIDLILISLFLLIVFINGIWQSQQIESVNIFAVGGVHFSMFALWSTVTATWVSGSGFFATLYNTYSKGLFYYIPSLFMSCCLLITAFVLIPRMQRFFRKTSVATVMREEYCDYIGSITAFCGFIGVSGSIAVQFKALTNVGCYFFGWSPELTLALFGGLTIIYTVWGGIESVVKTDKIQIVCFCIGVPVVLGFLCAKSSVDDFVALKEVDQFNIFKMHNCEDFSWTSMICLILYFATPGLQPTDFQRISMGVSTRQIQLSYIFSAATLLIIKLLLVIFPLALYILEPNIPSDLLLGKLLDNFTFPGVRAILAIGIICMAMSTADSFLNIGGVLIANDFWIFKKAHPMDQLFIARYCVGVLGVLAMALAYWKTDLLQIILLTVSFYEAVVSVPLLLLIFGYKTTNRCCLAGMSVAFLLVLKFKFIDQVEINVIPFIMVANFATMWIAHYTVEKWEWFKRFGITSKLHEIKEIA